MARTRKELAPAPPPAPPSVLDLEPTEEERHLEFVTRLMMRCLSKADIARHCREKFGFGTTRTENLIARILESLRVGHERNRPYTRAEQIARVRHLISKLHEPRFKSVKRDGQVVPVLQPMSSGTAARIVKLEDLLADLEGNREPVEVKVGVVMTQAAQAVFANLSDEKLASLIERAKERKRLAEAITVHATPV